MHTRPKEVIDWGHHRKSSPPIADMCEFHQRWIKWWGNCQPIWRSTEKWPYDRGDAKENDWGRLDATGPHGLFAVVMSASWWAGSMDSGSSSDPFSLAVEDLHWVTENLIYFNSQSKETQSKRVTTPLSNFPGHGGRGAGKRQIKASYKAANNP